MLVLDRHRDQPRVVFEDEISERLGTLARRRDHAVPSILRAHARESRELPRDQIARRFEGGRPYLIRSERTVELFRGAVEPLVLELAAFACALAGMPPSTETGPGQFALATGEDRLRGDLGEAADAPAILRCQQRAAEAVRGREMARSFACSSGAPAI